MAVQTLADIYVRTIDNIRKPDAFLAKRDGVYQPISTAAFDELVRRIMDALLAEGIGPGDRVAILSENRPEWPAVDFACALLGAVLVPLYPNAGPKEVAHILGHSGARILFLSQLIHVETLAHCRASLPGLRTIVALSGLPEDAGTPWNEWLKSAARREPLDGRELSEFAARIRPGDLATLIYTSGTTGVPKGVMLTHGSLVQNMLLTMGDIPVGPEDVALSFLPLAHVYERIVDLCGFFRGVTIAYAERLDPQVLAANIQEVKPTLMASVPRLYEKMLAKVQARMRESRGVRRALLSAGIRVAMRFGAAQDAGRNHASPALRLQHALLTTLVLGKIRRILFGPRIRMLMSGGAPLPRSVAAFYWGLGLPLLEGYGLTEAAPVITVNTPKEFRLGSVGKVLPSVEIRLGEDGEVFTRSACVMQGYYHADDETAACIDGDGWLATGDIGRLDEDGYLYITDRKKALLVTAGGKNVAPQPLEALLKSHPAVANAVVVGDSRPFISALIVPDPVYFASSLGELPPSDLTHHPAVLTEVRNAVHAANEGLSNYEQIRAFAILPRDLRIEDEELTPTLKARREVVLRNFASEVESLYAGAESATL